MSATVTSQLNGQCYLLIYIKKNNSLMLGFPKGKASNYSSLALKYKEAPKNYNHAF